MSEVMYGYSNQMITWAEMEGKATWNRLHPEMRRRYKALVQHMAAKGVPLGIGTGWRVQPAVSVPPGRFAAPGNSWHESCPVNPPTPTALAIDVVPASSWNAMEMELINFHLKSFRHVNNEPWHIQPIEIPTSRRRATVLPPLHSPALPGGDVPAAVVAADLHAVAPDPDVPTAPLKSGDSGLRVIHLQNILIFWGWAGFKNWDGRYGGQTVAAVKTMQGVIGATQDGGYGPQTRAKLIAWVKNLQAMAG